MKMGHGGNIFQCAKDLRCSPDEILDMSSNINPLGPVPGLMEHLKKHMTILERLPEPGAERATKAFGLLRDLSPLNLAPGNGTTQLIYALPPALGLKKALIIGPVYEDYNDALKLNNTRVKMLFCKKEQNFLPDLNLIDKIVLQEKVDAIFICNPNNPTGAYIPGDELCSLARKLSHVLLVVDESYLGFKSCEKNNSIAKAGLDNVLTLISLSKLYGMAGLRVGFCHGPEKVIRKILKWCPPWSLNAFAQEALLYFRNNSDKVLDHEKNTRLFLIKEKIEFLSCFKNFGQVSFFPGEASFILGRLKKGNAKDLRDFFLNHKILIRNCSNFHGLNDKYFRISLKDSLSNKKARELLSAWLEA